MPEDNNNAFLNALGTFGGGYLGFKPLGRAVTKLGDRLQFWDEFGKINEMNKANDLARQTIDKLTNGRKGGMMHPINSILNKLTPGVGAQKDIISGNNKAIKALQKVINKGGGKLSPLRYGLGIAGLLAGGPMLNGAVNSMRNIGNGSVKEAGAAGVAIKTGPGFVKEVTGGAVDLLPIDVAPADAKVAIPGMGGPLHKSELRGESSVDTVKRFIADMLGLAAGAKALPSLTRKALVRTPVGKVMHAISYPGQALLGGGMGLIATDKLVDTVGDAVAKKAASDLAKQAGWMDDLSDAWSKAQSGFSGAFSAAKDNLADAGNAAAAALGEAKDKAGAKLSELGENIGTAATAAAHDAQDALNTGKSKLTQLLEQGKAKGEELLERGKATGTELVNKSTDMLNQGKDYGTQVVNQGRMSLADLLRRAAGMLNP